MPCRKSCKLTMENIDERPMPLYYQVTYALTDIPADAAYLHAQFRRANPLLFKQDYAILDGVRGQRHYVGTYLAWGVHNTGWRGEGELKVFMDGDGEVATIRDSAPHACFRRSDNFESRQ